jgi:hypothetical protein
LNKETVPFGYVGALSGNQILCRRLPGMRRKKLVTMTVTTVDGERESFGNEHRISDLAVWKTRAQW